MSKLTQCCVPLCTSVHGTTTNVMFHTFPMGDHDLLQKWTHNIEFAAEIAGTKFIHSLTYGPNVYNLDHVVCSKHFADSDYSVKNLVRRLNKDAIPRVFSEIEMCKPVSPACKDNAEKAEAASEGAAVQADGREGTRPSVVGGSASNVDLSADDGVSAATLPAGARWLDTCCVTVYGFVRAILPDVISKFGEVGTIVEFKPEENTNWVHIRFQTESQANAALGRNATCVDRGLMVGVKPCSYVAVKVEEEEGTPSEHSACVIETVKKEDESCESMDDDQVSDVTHEDDEEKNEIGSYQQETEGRIDDAVLEHDKSAVTPVAESQDISKATYLKKPDISIHEFVGEGFPKCRKFSQTGATPKVPPPGKEDVEFTILCKVCQKRSPCKASEKKDFVCTYCNDPIPCKDCGEYFYGEQKLAKHFIMAHMSDSPKHIIAAKKKYFYIEGHLNDPKTSSTKKSTLKLVCKQCGESFASESSLAKHFSVSHVNAEAKANDKKGAGAKLQKCKTCQRSFPSDMNSLKDDTCIFCLRSFGCDNCKRCFYDQESLNKHILHAHALEPEGVESSAMDIPDNHVCSECYMSFPDKKSLRFHCAYKHGGEKPFKCQICTYDTFIHSSYQRHCLVHTRERPHLCDTCGKAFKSKANLKTHINTTHTGKKAFQCDRCFKCFPAQDFLTKHHQKCLTDCGKKRVKRKGGTSEQEQHLTEENLVFSI